MDELKSTPNRNNKVVRYRSYRDYCSTKQLTKFIWVKIKRDLWVSKF